MLLTRFISAAEQVLLQENFGSVNALYEFGVSALRLADQFAHDAVAPAEFWLREIVADLSLGSVNPLLMGR